MSEPLEYAQARALVKWGERHGLLQFPGREYPYPLGVDPTKDKSPIPFKLWLPKYS